MGERSESRHAAHGTQHVVRRRGILAAAAVVVAGIAARQVAQPVAAANGGSQGTALILGATSFGGTANTCTATTTILNNGASEGSFYYLDAFKASATGTGAAGVTGLSSGGTGVYGGIFFAGDAASTKGVFGTAGMGTAVYGLAATGTGVYGESQGSALSKSVYGKHTSGYAVYGEATASLGYGVTGVAADAYGVLGMSGSGPGTAGTSASGVGAQGTSTSGVGVLGVSQSSIGVQGQAHGIGVYGLSDSSYGILGVTTAGGVYSGVTGSITTPTGAAFAGGASQASAYAAYFTGKVNIDGPFLVNGSQRFTLKHADGTSRLVSGALSVEPVVEDFGTGQLANGSASVALDADFRAVADTSDYHVFLTPFDAACKGLAVTERRADGFVVQELHGGASAGAFAWRVVARPRGEGKAQRLAKYESPAIKIPGINGEPPPPQATPRAPRPLVDTAPPPPDRSPERSPGPNPAPPPRTAPAATAPPPAPAAPVNGQPAAPPPAPPPRT